MRSHWEKVQNSFVPMQMPGSNDSEKGQAIPKALDSSSYYPPIPDYNYSQGLKQYPDNSNLNYAPLNESRNNYNNPYGDFNKYNNSYGYNENNNNNGQRGYHVVQPFDGVVEPNQSLSSFYREKKIFAYFLYTILMNK